MFHFLHWHYSSGPSVRKPQRLWKIWVQFPPLSGEMRAWFFPRAYRVLYCPGTYENCLSLSYQRQPCNALKNWWYEYDYIQNYRVTRSLMQEGTSAHSLVLCSAQSKVNQSRLARVMYSKNRTISKVFKYRLSGKHALVFDSPQSKKEKEKGFFYAQIEFSSSLICTHCLLFCNWSSLRRV